MRIKLDPGAYMPERAHPFDAGLDLRAKDGAVIPAGGSARFDTGVHIELPPHTAGFLKSRSGMYVRLGLTGEGVIDTGYTGSIVVKLSNSSKYDYIVQSGDKIIQLVIVRIELPELELVDSLEEAERGNNGFGSTGR